MKKYLFLFLMPLLSLLSCNQDKGNSQRQMQERRQETAENTPQTAPAPTQTSDPVAEEAYAEPAPADDSRTPATTAGDRVVAVKDGDTIELLRNGEKVTVRLYGIDTPEKNQDFGQRAKQFTSDLAFNQHVRLIVHNIDRYGRTVGTIILPDGRNLNEELVKSGFAWHYKAYSKDKNLANLEADARRFKRGLWQDPNPVAPWDFRKPKNTAATTKPVSVAPIPAGATKRQVYLCNSSSQVYHLTQNCSVLKRCKQEVLNVTEAVAIREHSRRLDKTCSPK